MDIDMVDLEKFNDRQAVEYEGPAYDVEFVPDYAQADFGMWSTYMGIKLICTQRSTMPLWAVV